MISDTVQFEHEPLEVIPIHFDVTDHHLPLDDFIEAAKNTQAIIDGFNESLFDKKLKYELYVIPPKPGTFLEIIGFLATAVGVIFVYSQTEDGKVFFENLTGHPTSFWHAKAGEKLREKLQKAGETAEELDKDQLVRHVEALLLVQVIKSFLQKSEEELSKAGAGLRKFRTAFEARNQFYEVCRKNKSIRAVGFSEEDTFPIKRSDFIGLQVNLPPIEEENEQPDWKAGIERIIVPGPMWRRKLQERKRWFAIYGKKQEAHFLMEDEAFWLRRDDGSLHLQPNDRMKVQWAYVEKGNRRSQFRVLRVLEYNDEYFADPLSDDVLETLLGNFIHETKDLPDLFDDPE